MPTDDERQTFACPPHWREFVHQTAITLWSNLWSGGDIPAQPYVAECWSPRPQPRCSCGRFDLYWEPTAQECDDAH